MVTMAVVEGIEEQQRSVSLGAKDGVSQPSVKEIADPVVYKLVRVDQDGRIVPATDDEVMEVDDLLLEGDKSELPIVADTGCVVKDGLLPLRIKLPGSEGISTSAEVKVLKLNAPVEETVPLVSHGVNDKCGTQVGVAMCLKPKGLLKLSGSSSLASGSSSMQDFSKTKGKVRLVNGVNDKCSTQMGVEKSLKPGFLKISGLSSLASATCMDKSLENVPLVGVEKSLKPTGLLKISGSSSLASGSSSMPDFSKTKGKVCLDNGVNDKCSTQVGVEKCLKPTGLLKISGSSSLASGSRSMPDFSKTQGKVCLDNEVNDKSSTQVGVEKCLTPTGLLKISGSSSLASGSRSMPEVGVEKCLKPTGLLKISGSSSLVSGTCSTSTPDFSKTKGKVCLDNGVNDKGSTPVGVEMCLKPTGFLKISGSSSLASATCSSSIPDFSKIKGEICLDNLTVKELHETFRATFGRETTVKDKLWLKRRIAMGLTNSCDVATSTFIIKDKTLIRRQNIEGEALCEIKSSKSEDQVDGIFKGSRKDCPITPTNQVGDEQVSGKRPRKSEAEDEYGEDPHNEHTKRKRKPTKRYIEELSEVENTESSGKPMPSVKNSGNCQSEPKPQVTPVQSVGLDRPVLVTRQESFGGSGVQVPYVSRVRRGRPRENFMPLMKFHPGSMDVDPKPVMKTHDVCVSLPDNNDGDKDQKAKSSPQQSEQPIVAEKKKEEKEDKENHNDAETCISVEKEVEMNNVDLAEDNSDHNVKGQSTTKGEPIRKHHRAWTLDEVTQLVDGVSKYGAGRWSEIKRHSFSASSYRTSVDLKDKWRNLLRASFAHSPAVRDMLNSKKPGAMAIPPHILSRVRELADKYSQVPPPPLSKKVSGRGGGGLSRKIGGGGGFGRKIKGVKASVVSGGSSVASRPIVNETRSGFL